MCTNKYLYVRSWKESSIRWNRSQKPVEHSSLDRGVLNRPHPNSPAAKVVKAEYKESVSSIFYRVYRVSISAGEGEKSYQSQARGRTANPKLCDKVWTKLLVSTRLGPITVLLVFATSKNSSDPLAPFVSTKCHDIVQLRARFKQIWKPGGSRTQSRTLQDLFICSKIGICLRINSKRDEGKVQMILVGMKPSPSWWVIIELLSVRPFFVERLTRRAMTLGKTSAHFNQIGRSQRKPDVVEKMCRIEGSRAVESDSELCSYNKPTMRHLCRKQRNISGTKTYTRLM